MAQVAALTVECGNSDCEAVGVRRAVTLQHAAFGVIAKPTLLCQFCGHVVKEVREPEK